MSPIFRAAIRPIFLFTWSFFAVHAVFMGIGAARAQHPVLWVGSFATCLLWAVVVSLTNASRPLYNWLALLTVPASIWAVFENLDAAGLGSYANWWPGPCTVLAAFFALYGRRLMALWVLLVGFGSSLLISGLYLGGEWDTILYSLSAMSGPVIWACAIAGTVELISRLSTRQLGLESLTVQRSEDAAVGRRAFEQQERDLEVMRTVSEEHLREIASLDPEVPMTAEQRRRWDLGALTLRDELASRAFLDDRLRASIRGARGRGGVVDLQDGFPDGGPIGEQARGLFLSAANMVREGERLSLRRQAGRTVVSVAYVGVAAETWLDSLGPLPRGVTVIREEELAHLTFDQELLETRSP